MALPSTVAQDTKSTKLALVKKTADVTANLVQCFEDNPTVLDLFENLLDAGRSDEGFRFLVVVVEIFLDGGLHESTDPVENATMKAF